MIERDYIVERNLSGTVELSRSYNAEAEHWRVRVTLRDEITHMACHFFVAVHLPETASKNEVYQVIGPRIQDWFKKLNEFWVAAILDILTPTNP